MIVGDRVELTVNKGMYSPGASGEIVAVNSNDTINVDLDEDHNGNTIDPVFHDIGSSKSDYQVV